MIAGSARPRAAQAGGADCNFLLLPFLHYQNFNYLCTPTDDGFIPRVSVNPDFSFAAVRKAVAEIKERLEEFGREELVKISKSGVTPTTDEGEEAEKASIFKK